VVDIEQLKQDFTDKYVVVDAARPELKRFEGHVGQIKTVNMNGRALVQFDAWNNIGWYDIGLDYLKVVPKPEASAGDAKKENPKPVKAAAKPAEGATPAAAGEKKLSPLEMARMQGAAKKPGAQPAAGGEKKSTADILAAARANKPASAEAKPAAAKPAAAPQPAATGGKMSTADILAAARAKKSAESAPVAEPEPAVAEPAPVDEVKAAIAKPTAAKEAPAAFPPGQRPTVPQILDWCRQHDAK
jgi:hypothetical protein